MSADVACTSISREQLYERAWKTPMRHLAKEFGMSDVGLAKHCRRHDIPTPPVGYWAKLAHGKRVSRPKLPPIENGGSVIDLSRDVRELAVEVPLSATFFDPEIGRLAEQESQRPPIAISNSLRSPHPLVARTQAALQACTNSKFHRSGELLHPHGIREEILLDIVVGKPLVSRALRICDALLKACEERGYQVGAAKQSWRSGRAHIHAHGKSFELKIREPAKRTLRELTVEERDRLRRNPDSYISNRYEYTLTGTLLLELAEYSLPFFTMHDGKKRRVEDGLNRLFLAILREADEGRKHAAEAARREAERLDLDAVGQFQDRRSARWSQRMPH